MTSKPTSKPSPIRVTASKNPWNIKKTKSKLRNGSHSSQGQCPKQWPGLKSGPKNTSNVTSTITSTATPTAKNTSISTAPQKTSGSAPKPASITRHNSLDAAPPNIKYRSNQNRDNGPRGGSTPHSKNPSSTTTKRESQSAVQQPPNTSNMNPIAVHRHSNGNISHHRPAVVQSNDNNHTQNSAKRPQRRGHGAWNKNKSVKATESIADKSKNTMTTPVTTTTTSTAITTVDDAVPGAIPPVSEHSLDAEESGTANAESIHNVDGPTPRTQSHPHSHPPRAPPTESQSQSTALPLPSPSQPQPPPMPSSSEGAMQPTQQMQPTQPPPAVPQTESAVQAESTNNSTENGVNEELPQRKRCRDDHSQRSNGHFVQRQHDQRQRHDRGHQRRGNRRRARGRGRRNQHYDREQEHGAMSNVHDEEPKGQNFNHHHHHNNNNNNNNNHHHSYRVNRGRGGQRYDRFNHNHNHKHRGHLQRRGSYGRGNGGGRGHRNHRGKGNYHDTYRHDHFAHHPPPYHGPHGPNEQFPGPPPNGMRPVTAPFTPHPVHGPHLWNQPAVGPTGMLIPVVPLLSMQSYPTLQSLPATDSTTATAASTPRTNTKDGSTTTTNTTTANGEAEERKSDTTTASNSTVPPPAATPGSNSAATMTTTTGSVGGNMVYNVSPYAMNMNPYLPMFVMEPPENVHLLLNQKEAVPSWSGGPDLPVGPYYVLKVSCVATGRGADDRSVGHIALVDWFRQTKANVFVKPSDDIVSYLEPLTSLTPSLLDKYGYPLEKAVTIIRSELPSNAVLVGQNITMDLQWLGLRHGVDFNSFIDLRDLWRSWSEHYKSYTHYSLSHQAKCILGAAPMDKHSASMDALTTMKLLQYYLWCRKYSIPLLHSKVAVLGHTPISPSFAKRHPTFEGVRMQSKKYKGVPYITANPNRHRQTKRGDDDDGDINGDDINTTNGRIDQTVTATTNTTTSSTNNNSNDVQTVPIDPPPSADAAAIV